jgi:YidC/Oxa1 family membrane protein insertase
MFEGFFDFLGGILNFFYTLIPSYGIAIMLLTVLVMVLITPLTVKSTRSMLQMQRMQPEMKRLQAKYKDDREKLNEELMKFYRENKINPLGGCLPIVAQMPVFIIMYRLLRGLTTRQGGLGSGIGHIAGQVRMGDTLTPWIFTNQLFRPEHLNKSTELYKSLATTSKMNFLGMDLALSASQALKIGFITVLPYLALLLIMLITGIYQNRQLQARNTSGTANPQQQALMKVMPFFLPVFSFGFPSGLALYWCTQNFCRIGTNAYITKSVYRKEHPDHAIETSAKEKDTPAKGGGAQKGGGASKKAAIAGGAAAASKNGKTDNGKTDNGKTDNGKSANGKATPAPEKTPGKSVKSQRAQEKASDPGPSGGSTSAKGSAASVNPRRSGEARRRKPTEKE